MALEGQSKTGGFATNDDEGAPTTTDFLNLSGFMYMSYDTPYSSTPLEADIGYKPLMEDGKPVILIDNANGVYAEAFESTSPTNKQVILGFEGTKSYFQGNEFTAGQLIDDLQLYGGKAADFFPTVVSFTNQVIKLAAADGIAKKDVFVTGHSLGAAEAEYASAKTGLGGESFAGPGINAEYTGGTTASNFTDYVDAGDPVGNYAADGNNPISSVLVSNNIKHYGDVDDLSNAYGRAKLIAFNQLYKNGGPRDKQAAVLGAIATNGKYHELSRYASDLDVPLYLKDASEGADDDFFGVPGASEQVATTALCFCSGTRFMVEGGEKPVEELRTGDRVATRNGILRPIKWVGHRKLNCSRHCDPQSLWPVRIAPHTFGPDQPKRDLYLSPGHSICIDVAGEVLIPAIALVNGNSIQQVRVDDVTYWHVELDTHDILLAENMPAESYLEMGNRDFFAEAETVALHARPDAPVATHADFCRPYVDAGPRLEAVRATLRERQACAGTLHEVIAAA